MKVGRAGTTVQEGFGLVMSDVRKKAILNSRMAFFSGDGGN